jgi:hypothetical protein
MTDAVRFICPNLACRAVLSVPRNARGKTVRCRSCRTNIRVPSGEKPKAPVAPGEEKEGEN